MCTVVGFHGGAGVPGSARNVGGWTEVAFALSNSARKRASALCCNTTSTHAFAGAKASAATPQEKHLSWTAMPRRWEYHCVLSDVARQMAQTRAAAAAAEAAARGAEAVGTPTAMPDTKAEGTPSAGPAAAAAVSSSEEELLL